MCGLVGAWGDNRGSGALLGAVRSLAHRGPDDSGIWADDATGIALGHTRLAILDLSAAGHQPMVSACSRYVIVFNGEIYNHLELRKALGAAAPSWRGHSDTETLLACFSAWGIERTLKAMAGMWAIALWDKASQKLVLARDRFGEKPLYYGYVGATFAFGSELKALTQLSGFARTINRGALALMLRHNYVPTPYCIYEGLLKLPAGTWLELNLAMQRRYALPDPQPYWSAFDAALNGMANPLTFKSDGEAALALEAELLRAIGAQMLADVPVGAFLSGGIDSSIVVALMQQRSQRPVKSFSIGFREHAYDEAPYARAVAQHLGSQHTELYVSPDEALAVIPSLPEIYDEPFSDSSQIPTYLVARLARQHVTVALSGDGGDELFGGYNRYFLAARLWRTIEHIPSALRRGLAHVILSIPTSKWDRLVSALAQAIPKARGWKATGDKLHKGAALLGVESGADLYRGLVSHWDPKHVVLNSIEPPSALTNVKAARATLTERMMVLDSVSYLPDDILVKVDRAAMAVSLETRVPLLDHRLFEFAYRLPLHYKVRGGSGKWLLRQVLRKHVPAKLFERPKMGFGVPIGDWLRGPLRDWAEELLGEDRLKRETFFNPHPIRQKWCEHLSGQRNWQYHLWDVLMFQAWRERSLS
jgi:asparagine synthase (glutamine-hydrolysing)